MEGTRLLFLHLITDPCLLPAVLELYVCFARKYVLWVGFWCLHKLFIDKNGVRSWEKEMHLYISDLSIIQHYTRMLYLTISICVFIYDMILFIICIYLSGILTPYAQEYLTSTTAAMQVCVAGLVVGW